MSGIDLSTEYLGLKLANPLVPSASPLSRSLDSARRLEDAGAAAIVMYSLFEEELLYEGEMAARFLINQEIGHGEADSFLPFDDQFQQGLDLYLEQLASLKNALGIPVIASLNGISLDGWVEHGKMLQQAGADALELNVYYLSTNFNESGSDVENRYVQLLRELRGAVDIPIAMKLSPYFSALPNFIKTLEHEGANGVVLFNRFYQPDFDPDGMHVVPQLHLSTSADALLVMRWIALISGQVKLSIAASGGIHDGRDAIKSLLAGTDVVNLCATLLLNGPGQLRLIKDEIIHWMEDNEFSTIHEFRGRLNHQFCDDAEALVRANYVMLLNSYGTVPGVKW